MPFLQLRHPRFWAPALVLALGCAVTGLTVAELGRSERDHRDMQVSNLADGFGALLQMHLNGCEEALRSASMVVSVDPRLNAAQWQAVARQVRVGEFNACAESIFYVSAGPQRQWLVFPQDAPPSSATGLLDPWNDPAQRAAMEAARDEGRPRLTRPVAWPGMAQQDAVVVWYMPVYRRDAATDTPEDRRAALLGHVGTPIRVAGVVDVLSQQLPNARLTLECHAGTRDLFEPSAQAAGTQDDALEHTHERTLRVGGSWWTLHAGLIATPSGPLRGLRPSGMALAAGLVLSVLSAWLTRLMLTQSARAHTLANRYSRDARERELRLRSVLDGTRDAIFTLDLQGRVLGANHAAQAMLGRTEAELLNQDVRSLVPPGRLDEYRGYWTAFLRSARQRENGHGPTQELELHRPDGRTMRVRSNLCLVRSEAGEFVVWMIGDVTHEREMEHQAHQAATLNQAIMDAAPIGVMTIGADGRVTTANRALHAMHGYAVGDLVSRPAEVLNDLPDTRSTGWDEPGSGTARNEVKDVEVLSVRRDGSRFPASVIALPLRDGGGQALGELRIVTDITERKRAAAKIEHIALHDSLTGLPNRLLLQDRGTQTLARARRHGGGCALVLIDLDRFKQINDTLGHAAGDEVLKIAAQRLVNAVRESDTVARMGGDEFALLLPELQHGEQAAEVARKVLAALAEDLAIEGHRLHITGSIGIALYPAHGADLETLLRHADLAMYNAKERGRDTVSLYDQRMSAQASDQLVLQTELREALGRGQFVLHYQPLVGGDDGQVHALEALLRWRHPQRGLVAPADFIPLAEDTGLIVPIGAWVLRQACLDLAQLRRQGRADLRMAVNLSPRQFQADGLEICVQEALQAAGLDGSALELEITESVLMNSVERTQGILAALRAMGVRIAIDDFGTGYSSLAYLAHFPVQTVKVDRSFVRQIDSGEGTALLAGAIVAMAHRLGLEVVAEGIETLAQHSHLVDLGCELLQGYRFSKPVALEQLGDALQRVEAMARVDPNLRMEIWLEPALPV